MDLIGLLDESGTAVRTLDFAYPLEAPVRLAVYPVPAPKNLLPTAPRLQVLNCDQIIGGRKQAHEIRDPADDWLWTAGLWKEHPVYGRSHTMVTTAASPLMSPVQDRMPALLRPEEMAEWLAGTGSWDFQPFTGPLVVSSCESPLARRQTQGPQQPELF